MVRFFNLKLTYLAFVLRNKPNVTQMKKDVYECICPFASPMVEWEQYGEKLKLSRKSRGKHEPEYLYSIATDLGLQFDGEARVMYGEREGFCWSLKALKPRMYLPFHSV